MGVASERDALEAALTFYATPANYEPVEIPDELVPAGERMVFLFADGREVPAKMYRSGPAVDGGAHARYVLGLLEAGEL
jgi:hypothetical protein